MSLRGLSDRLKVQLRQQDSSRSRSASQSTAPFGTTPGNESSPTLTAAATPLEVIVDRSSYAIDDYSDGEEDDEHRRLSRNVNKVKVAIQAISMMKEPLRDPWHVRLRDHLTKQTHDFNSRARLQWDAVVLFFVLVNAIFVPFALGLPNTTKDAGLLAMIRTFWYFGDLVFLFDIFLNMKTTYVEEGLVVTDQGRILRHYLKSWFATDLVASLPLDLLFIFDFRLSTFMRIPKLLRLLRFYRYFANWERYSQYPNLLRLIKLVISLFLLVHWVGSAYAQLGYANTLGSTTYLPPAAFDNFSLGQEYVYVFYWAAVAILLGGEGLQVPVNTDERMFSLVVVIISVFAFATIIGNVTTILQNVNKDAQSFSEHLDSINRFMDQRRLPLNMKRRVRQYFDYLWSRQHGHNDNEVLAQLPGHLRADISHYLHRDLIAKVPFFKECVPGFITSLVQHLQPRIYPPGDFVVRVGDQGREIFFVRLGRLTVLSATGTVLAKLSDGAFFGEIALLYSVTRTASVRADTFCDILVLRRSDLELVLEQYPEQRLLLQRTAEKRLSSDRLRSLIRAVPMFSDASKDFVEALIRKMRPHTYHEGDYIIQAGEWSTNMYFLDSGTVNYLSSEGTVVREVTAENQTDRVFFGEIALLFQTQRTLSVRAQSRCEIYVLSKNDLDTALAWFPQQRRVIETVARGRLKEDRTRHIELLENVSFLTDGDPAFLSMLVQLLKHRTYQEGDMVIKEGQVGNEMFFLNYGHVGVLGQHGNVVRTLTSGAYFGEVALLMDQPRRASLKAMSFCDMFYLPRKDLESCLEAFPEMRQRFDEFAAERHEREKENVTELFRKSVAFKACEPLMLGELSEACEPIEVPAEAGDFLAQVGLRAQELFVLVSGEVQLVTDEGEIFKTISEGTVLNEVAVILDQPQPHSIRATKDCVILYLEKERFDAIVREFPLEHQGMLGGAELLLNSYKADDGESLRVPNVGGDGRSGRIRSVSTGSHDGKVGKVGTIRTVRDRATSRARAGSKARPRLPWGTSGGDTGTSSVSMVVPSAAGVDRIDAARDLAHNLQSASDELQDIPLRSIGSDQLETLQNSLAMLALRLQAERSTRMRFSESIRGAFLRRSDDPEPSGGRRPSLAMAPGKIVGDLK